MTQATPTVGARMVDVLGGKVHVLSGGRGDPLVILHRDNSYPGWQPFHEQLARHATVHIPSLPGYHNSDPSAWTWLWDVRDLAVVLHHLFKAMGWHGVTVLGLGFGGWLAAEMATMGDQHIGRMVLVSPMGIKPERGEIFDQFLVGGSVYARTAFHDEQKFDEVYGAQPPFEQLERWETDREMTSRIGWKPYMHNRNLPRLLQGVTAPTLVVWGRQDRIVPLECGELYVKSLPRARLAVLDGCGHAVDLEKPNDLVRLITTFLREP